jgi:hypothetical protein
MSFWSSLENDFEVVLNDVSKYLVPIAQVAVESIPGLPPIASKIVAGVPSLITAFEAILPASGQGPVKLNAVLSAVQAICAGVDGVSTGGQSKTWAAISTTVNTLVNNSVAVVNTIQSALTTTPAAVTPAVVPASVVSAPIAAAQPGTNTGQ